MREAANRSFLADAKKYIRHSRTSLAKIYLAKKEHMSVSTIHEAKTNLSRLIQKAERGEEVVIARGKTPVAKIVPIKKGKKKRIPGMFKGVFKVGPEFFEPLPKDELRLWNGEGD